MKIKLIENQEVDITSSPDYKLKPTLREPTPMGKKVDSEYKKQTMIKQHEIRESYDAMLSEDEKARKKKIFKLGKMESLVHNDDKLSRIYAKIVQDDPETKFGYHYNETVMNMLFNDYVLNNPQYMEKYKNAVPTKKKRRDKTGINQLINKGEEKMDKDDGIDETIGIDSKWSRGAITEFLEIIGQEQFKFSGRDKGMSYGDFGKASFTTKGDTLYLEFATPEEAQRAFGILGDSVSNPYEVSSRFDMMPNTVMIQFTNDELEENVDEIFGSLFGGGFDTANYERQPNEVQPNDLFIFDSGSKKLIDIIPREKFQSIKTKYGDLYNQELIKVASPKSDLDIKGLKQFYKLPSIKFASAYNPLGEKEEVPVPPTPQILPQPVVKPQMVAYADGLDNFGRKVYLTRNGKMFVDVEGVLHVASAQGEPMYPAKNVKAVDNTTETTGSASSGSFGAPAGFIPQKKIDETTTSASSGQYSTPIAFSKNPKKGRFFAKPIWTGGVVVKEGVDYITNPKAFSDYAMLVEAFNEVEALANESSEFADKTEKLSYLKSLNNLYKMYATKLNVLGDEYKGHFNALLGDIKNEIERVNTIPDAPDDSEPTPMSGNAQYVDTDVRESTDQERYEDVVFMQGEEAEEPLAILHDQGEDAAMEYLKQWHDSGHHMGRNELSHGSSDQTYEKDGYIMSWNDSLQYIGLLYDFQADQGQVQEEPSYEGGMRADLVGMGKETPAQANSMSTSDLENEDGLFKGGIKEHHLDTKQEKIQYILAQTQATTGSPKYSQEDLESMPDQIVDTLYNKIEMSNGMYEGEAPQDAIEYNGYYIYKSTDPWQIKAGNTYEFINKDYDAEFDGENWKDNGKGGGASVEDCQAQIDELVGEQPNEGAIDMETPVMQEQENQFFEISTPVGSPDDKMFVSIVNKGIDSHLEGFTKSKFEVSDTSTGKRRFYKFHNSELPILIRRLEELGTEGSMSWAEDIKTGSVEEPIYEKAKSKTQKKYVGIMNNLQKDKEEVTASSDSEIAEEIIKEINQTKMEENYKSIIARRLNESKQARKSVKKINEMSTEERLAQLKKINESMIDPNPTSMIADNPTSMKNDTEDQVGETPFPEIQETVNEERKTNSMLNLERIKSQNAKNTASDNKKEDALSDEKVYGIPRPEDSITKAEVYPNPKDFYIEQDEAKVEADLKKDTFANIEKEKLAQGGFKKTALANVGDAVREKDFIPKRNMTPEEQKKLMLNRGAGMEDIVYDNKPSKKFDDRMKKDMGPEVTKNREEKIAFKAEMPMYNKDSQPTEKGDKTTQDNKYEKGYNTESVTAVYIDPFGKRKFKDFNLSEAKEIAAVDETYCKLDLGGMGNIYTQKVKIDEGVKNEIDTNVFYVKNNEVFKVKVSESKSINESIDKVKFDKMKHFMNYKPSKFVGK